MTSASLLGAAAAVAIFALPAAALAQAQAPMSGPGVDASAPNRSVSGPAGQPGATDANGSPVNAADGPPAQVHALAKGDNTMVTNGPVPDTAANRAKYGKPMSHAGKKTAPAGN